MKVLLHICCAPCAIHPFQELSKEARNSVTGFFYNPNIHPFSEMDRRRRAVADYADGGGLRVIFGDYDAEAFLRKLGTSTEAPSRCRACWRMRLEKTARRAREEDFDAFTTTLLVSPHQDRGAIVEIGSEAAGKFDVRFLDDDWRAGFRQAQQAARENNIYRQKYCGCIFSEKERFSNKR